MLAPQEVICFLVTTKSSIKKSSQGIKISFEKQVCEVRKSENSTFEISTCEKNGNIIFFFKKCVLAPREVNCSPVETKIFAKESSSTYPESILKNKSLKYEKIA